MESRFEHPCDCSERTFWTKVAFDEEFNRRLFLDELDFDSFATCSLHETDTEIRRLVEAAPKVAGRVPEAFRRFLRRGLAYRETDIFDKTTNRCRSIIVPHAFSRRFSITVELSTSPTGDARCNCLFVVNAIATVFVSLGGTSSSGIGRVIEEEILEQFMDGCRTRADFTNRFIAEKGLEGL